MIESEIKRQIMDYLNALPGCYARVIQVSGIRGRTSPSKGVLDIVGVYQGKAFAIEVKTKTGKLEESQKEFLRGWVERGGGLAFVARSVEEVEIQLRTIVAGNRGERDGSRNEKGKST